MRDVRYGAQEMPLVAALLGRVDLTCALPTEIAATEAPAALVGTALEHPVGPRLRDLARGARSAVVLIPGIDRVAAVGAFALPVLRELDEAGIPRAGVRFFLATGTHEHKGLRDLHALLGPHVAAVVDGAVHDCRGSGFVEMGVTARGTRVEFARAVIESEVKVLTGRAVPHYFAGFGGGRKALLPGVASYTTITDNHRLTLAAERGIAKGVAPCALAGNPVHLDMVEAARLATPAFALTTIIDANNRVVGVFAGEPEGSHEQACAFARHVHQVTVDEPLDGLITSAGGAPYDMNFMQSIKALFNVQESVRQGGPILWIAECPLGVAKAFLDWASVEDDAALERGVRAAYNLAGHNSIMLRHLVRRCEVGMVSSIPPDLVLRFGMHPLGSLEAGLRWLGGRLRPGAHVGYVPFGNVTHLALKTARGLS